MSNDSKHSSHRRLHNIDDDSICLKPVGVIRARFENFDRVSGADTDGWRNKAAFMQEQRSSISEIVVNDDLDGILDGIEEFSHLMVFFWGHLITEDKFSLRKVHPLGNPEFPLTGIFATHSPVRPNPILVTVVKLLERNGNVLKVSGLDALDGSPLLDIKPYSPCENGNDIKLSGWMREMHRQFEPK
jgi:tRNA-Thr(GGU) m(6)t(6)A37 methyltransferase TsaA